MVADKSGIFTYSVPNYESRWNQLANFAKTSCPGRYMVGICVDNVDQDTINSIVPKLEDEKEELWQLNVFLNNPHCF